jgi:hypothetical protein
MRIGYLLYIYLKSTRIKTKQIYLKLNIKVFVRGVYLRYQKSLTFTADKL